MSSPIEYDICLSFASEDREYVDQVAAGLRRRAVRVFYDRYEQAALWGKDLYSHLDYVYRVAARYCVIFASEHYAAKVWTAHERASAQSRALIASSEYILPVRFDDTEIVGLRPTLAYLDASLLSPSELVDLICKKLQLSDEVSPDFSPRWFNAIEYEFAGQRQELVRFQNRPFAGQAAALTATVGKIVGVMIERAVSSDGQVRWTHGSDREFDRLYVTSSVLTALLHAGASLDAPLVREGTEFLSRSDSGAVDDRAATIFLLTAHHLNGDEALSFVRMLADVQKRDPGSAYRGSFLLPQGPSDLSVPRAHWSDDKHADGASFHACHLADALLHIPAEFTEARLAAVDVLRGIREFLIRSLQANDGWLVSLEGDRTPLTTFAYALSSAMNIPLPKDWRLNSIQIMDELDGQRYGRITRCFGVMNAYYLYSVVGDEEFYNRAALFARSFLDGLPALTELDEWKTIDLSALLRAISYGVALIDHDMVPSLVSATERTMGSQNLPGGGKR